GAARAASAADARGHVGAAGAHHRPLRHRAAGRRGGGVRVHAPGAARRPRGPGCGIVTTERATAERGPRIAIIGAGPGGLAMAKRLLDEGFDDFLIFERNAGLGGTWYQNRYPGCECDVPSALYSFSFEFKADWSKPYGRQPEILAYM